jgi:cold shock CspA family protein
MTAQTFGLVTNVLEQKGFGFIHTPELGDVFFHKSTCGLWGSIKQGMGVTFNLIDTPKGKAAVDVALAPYETVSRAVEGFIWTEQAQPKRGEVVAAHKQDTLAQAYERRLALVNERISALAGGRDKANDGANPDEKWVVWVIAALTVFCMAL